MGAGSAAELTRALKEAAREAGFGLVGACAARPAESWEFYRRWVESGRDGEMGYLRESLELRRSVEALLPGARSVLMVGLHYNQDPDWEPGQARIARYALGRDYHKVIRGRLKQVGRRATELGVGHWRACVDSAPALEREYAQRAGLGWFGKNTCLIHSHEGSWFVVGMLLLDAEMESDEPSQGGCGTCQRCIEACPTGAIQWFEGRWVVDGRTCISALTIETKGEIPKELEAGIGEWTFGCDVCQEVCPFNQAREHQPRRAPETQVADFLERRKWPDLEGLSTISYSEWDQLTQGSPVRRAGWEGLKRNAQINLRNRTRP